MAIVGVATGAALVGMCAHRAVAQLPTTRVTLSPVGVAFGDQRLGTHAAFRVVTITNTTAAPVSLQGFTIGGADRTDFIGFTDCFPQGAPAELAVAGHCRVGLYFVPKAIGARHASLSAIDDAPSTTGAVPLSGVGTEGYFVADATGAVRGFGDAVVRGDASGIRLAAPMISLATTPDGAGYWLLARDGGIFSYGNARFYGSTGAIKLNQPIVALFPSATGHGYWLAASDGGIFTFGDAHFYGSAGSIRLNQPIDGMAATTTGDGYWLVSRDGGVFSFGDAQFYGSAGNIHLTAPVVQMTPTRSGNGYWLVTADGHLYAFGDAHDYGSAVGQAIVGMTLTADGGGYWETSRSGEVFVFGNAHPFGDLTGLGLDDVVGIAATTPALFG